MTMDGPMRRRCTGVCLTFAGTLAVSRLNLERVLDDFPDDAWMVKRVTSWTAFNRKVQLMARHEQARVGRGLAPSNLIQSLQYHADRGTPDYKKVKLSDEIRYLYGFISESNSKLTETILRGNGLGGDSRMALLEGKVDQLATSMDERLKGIEESIKQLLAGSAKG